MATSLIQNAIQVNFDSILSFPDEGMVQMFKALESTGLRGFLEVTNKPPVEKFVKKAAAKRRPAPAAELVAKRKHKTVGKAAPTEKDLAIVPVVQYPEPISIVPAESPSVERRRAPKIKLILQESDVEQDEVETKDTTDKEVSVEKETTEEIGPLLEKEKEEKKTYKEIETKKETEKEATNKGKRVENIIESEDTEPLRKQIPEEMMLPSVTAEEPTKIQFGHGIELKDSREVVVEEISSVFYSFSLCSLSTLQSVSDLAKKEEQVLQWAETDSLQTAVRRCLYIIAKYREMLLRKFLEAMHNNFESGTRTSAIDLQVLDLISKAHSISLINLLEQLKRLEWTRPSSSKLFGGADVYSRGVHSHFYPSVVSTSWEGLNTLRAQLSEIIAYINRRGDDKSRELESSRGPPPDYRSRPGSGSSRPGEGGSRSEPPKRGGG
ncbi:hypothetical protein F511_21125 [Dorcoceras hygrometricum]|uniref:Uncharacterized protein n=1 Tax=Dorcoceras hygrometricum TaxID=472368 RepID=A0A2Z7CT10_9LAMI|nr:hypothetical protein F511_21125 [Dorcoceras hygrometricum]